ncbi:MAG: carboxypeptidase-like regulatory domain-containing protein [Candidatus Paceibacterota bacterium]
MKTLHTGRNPYFFRWTFSLPASTAAVVFFVAVVISVGTPGSVEQVHAQSCDESADLSATIDVSASGGTHSATFTNTSDTCEYEIGLAVYKKIDEVVDNQILFEDNKTTIAANDTASLSVSVPDCAYQIDAFHGSVLSHLKGQRYGDDDRLLHARHLGGVDHCSLGGSGGGPSYDPIIDSFDATALDINEGATSTLTWDSRNTESCSGEGFETTGATTNPGDGVVVQPTTTTEYTLTCSNFTGETTSKRLTILVTEEGYPSVELEADPVTVEAGIATELSWTSEAADSCTSASFDTEGKTNGSISFVPEGGASYPYTVTYAITCTNPWGEVWDTASVTVVEPGSTFDVVIEGLETLNENNVTAALTADPSEIEEGEEAELRWSSTNAIACEGIGGGQVTSGVVRVAPKQTTGYEVVCTDAFGESARAAAKVTVRASEPAADPVSETEDAPEGDDEEDEDGGEAQTPSGSGGGSVAESEEAPSGGGSGSAGAPAPSAREGLERQLTEGVEMVRGFAIGAGRQVRELIETPEGTAVAKTVATAGVAAGGIASLSALFLAPLTVGEIFLIPLRLWSLILSLFGLKKKYRPWGTVYDSVTKQPLDPAYVVFENTDGEEVATSITDLDGRYGFLAQKGTYRIVANKTNYRFPSEKLAGRSGDELYSDLYFGEEFAISKDGEAVIKNIPLDPEQFDWNEFQKRDQKLMKFFSKRDVAWSRFVTTLFYIGFVFAVIAVWIAPAPYNAVIFGLYVVILALRFFGLRPRAYGHLVDDETGVPLSFAIVRVFQEDQEHEITHKVCDEYGRFYCLIPKGRYYLKIERKNSDESYSHVHTTPIINARNGIIKGTFEV